MGEVAGKTGCLNFIRNFEVKTFSALTPCRCVVGVISIEQERGRLRLQERGEMHRGCRLADAAFVAGDGLDHGVGHPVEIQVPGGST